jgi:uncharacterized protein YegP (UPF0339 family)
MASSPKVEVYKDKAGEYRWRAIDGIGGIVADSGEGYKTEREAYMGAAAAGRILYEPDWYIAAMKLETDPKPEA